jgi:hypothetical protein
VCIAGLIVGSCLRAKTTFIIRKCGLWVKTNANAMSFSAGQFLKRFWLAYFVAFLFLRSVVAPYWDEFNRFLFHWDRSDAIAVLLAVFIVGAILFAVGSVLIRLGKWGRLTVDFGFVCIAAFYLKVNVTEIMSSFLTITPQFNWLLKFALVGVVVVFLFRRTSVVRVVTGLCLIFSPIVPIYAARVLAAQPYQSAVSRENISDSSSNPHSPGVKKIYVFLFDEWSYDLTFANGEVSSDFPNIRRVAGDSIVFHRAYSPGPFTLLSVPPMLCGKFGKPVFTSNTLYLKEGDVLIPTHEFPHIFKEMKARGYTTKAIGNYLPYPELFPDTLDFGASQSIYKIFGPGLWNVSKAMLLENARIRLGWISPIFAKPFNTGKLNYFVRLQNWTHDLALQEIDNGGPAFVFIHYPIPHGPYVFDKNGPKSDIGWSSELYARTFDPYDPDQYLGNLHYTDKIIGELLDALQDKGDLDNSIIVMTSDHEFRGGKSRSTSARCRIPLLIHLPGQKGRVDVENPFSTLFLNRILLQYLDNKMNQIEFVELCSSFSETDIRYNSPDRMRGAQLNTRNF